MKQNGKNIKFAKLFKKYRLRSEIETLAEFGDLLAEEGLVYESSLFTRWQNGSRVPIDRKTILVIITIFIKHGGIHLVSEANQFLEAANQGYLTDKEKRNLPKTMEFVTNVYSMQNIGAFLKSHRLHKNVSQAEIVLALDLSDDAIIEKIEQGYTENPNKDFIEKYCQVLGLQKQEINNILLFGNYMPTKQEIALVQQKMSSVLESYQYSAVLYDFCWRVIYINQKHTHILEMKKIERELIHNTNPTAIEILFDPDFKMNKDLAGEDVIIWHQNLLRFLIHFRSLQKSIIKDEWYKNLIKTMMKNDLFQKIWQDSEEKKSDFITTRKGYKVFLHKGTRLTYHIYVVPLYDDPRFEIEFYTPADSATLQYYQGIKNTL